MFFVCIIIAFILLHYSTSIGNEFSLDDYLYMDSIREIHTWTDLTKIFDTPFSLSDYRPITTLTFAIEKLIFDGEVNPHFAHFINLSIYGLCVTFFYIFLKRNTTDEKYLPIVWISTIIFLSLPLHNSMISNLKSRDGLLSFMFGMIYLNAFQQAFKDNKTIIKLSYLLVAVVCIFLALYSKLDALNFLLITPFTFIIFLKKINLFTFLRSIFICLITFFLGAQLFNYWSKHKEIAHTETFVSEINDPVLFSENPIIQYTDITQKIFYSIQTYFEYIKMVFAPKGHYFYYGYDMVPILDYNHPKIILSIIILLALTLSIFYFYKKNKLVSWGIAFFLTSIIYCSNLITPVSGIIADRYIFIASAGASVVAGYFIYISTHYLYSKYLLVNTNIKSQFLNNLAYTVPIIFLTSIFYLPNNINRCKDWKNLESIFEADLQHISDRSYLANLIAMKNYMSLAKTHSSPMDKYYYQKVINYGNNAIKIYPDGQYAYDLLILAYYQNDLPYNALNLSKEAIQKFDSTEAGWKIQMEYYYYQSNIDSLLLSCKKLLQWSPLDPITNMIFIEGLEKKYNKHTVKLYLDSLKIKYPESDLPNQIISLNNITDI